MYKRINVHHMYKVRVSGPVKSYTHSRSGVCICRLNNAFYVSPFTAPLGFHPLLSACMTCPQKEFPNVDKDFILLQMGRIYLLFMRMCIVCSENKFTPLKAFFKLNKSTRVACDKVGQQENFFSANSGHVCLNTLDLSHRVTFGEDIVKCLQ